MPTGFSSLLDLKSLSSSQIENIFSLARSLKEQGRIPRLKGETLALFFVETSTRTRLSFETAAFRSGLGPLLFDGGQKTSLEKGETVEDSIFNIAAMKPSMMVIRCGDMVDLEKISRQIQSPILNAGWGTKGHPTQALLDLFTLQRKWGQIAGQKLLIVGDVKHSRVAASHVELAKVCGFTLGQCGPTEYLIDNPQVQKFVSLQEGLQWCDAVMALRFQFERHTDTQGFAKEDYRSQFGLNPNSLRALREDAPVLHPGPINYGIEMEQIVTEDSRSCILEQVTNGVYIREALIRLVLGETA
jgi:aspartate carbamoyltransferase catalytic subunit